MTSTGGAGVGGGPVGGTSTGGSAGSAPAGSGGAAAPVDRPLVDISGRWGMFTFEDPVGVQLVQAPDGTLTGRGCIAGAPDASGFLAPPISPDWCGQITGAVRGRAAAFGFRFTFAGQSGYSARVTVSEDGRRMAGVFNNGVADLEYPMAWLRVADDATWLPYTKATIGEDPAHGHYQLTLVTADSEGSEFQPDKAYLLAYTRDGIWGELGSFWNTELVPDTSKPNGALRVGPVPPTLTGLPTALSLVADGGDLRGVTASTASGGRYTFTAARQQP